MLAYRSQRLRSIFKLIPPAVGATAARRAVANGCSHHETGRPPHKCCDAAPRRQRAFTVGSSRTSSKNQGSGLTMCAFTYLDYVLCRICFNTSEDIRSEKRRVGKRYVITCKN